MPGLSKVTFAIEVINQGNVTATNVTVVDYVQPGFTFVAATTRLDATAATRPPC